MLSITDHDTVAGYGELTESYADVKIISGLELSAEYDTELHILGYNFDMSAKPICDVLTAMKDERVQRNKRILNKLSSNGVYISYEEMLNNYNSDTFGRVHIAKELVSGGYVKDVKEAFERYLSRGGLGYCKRELPSKQECIDAITKSGGIAVLAHPIYLSLHRKDLIKFIDELVGLGLSGVEAYHSAQDAPYSSYIVNICKDRNIYCTAGSDTHGMAGETYAPITIKDDYVLKSINKIYS